MKLGEVKGIFRMMLFIINIKANFHIMVREAGFYFRSGHEIQR